MCAGRVSGADQLCVLTIDNDIPTITCPNDITVVMFGTNQSVTWPAPVATDNMGYGTATVACSEVNGTVYATGARQVQCNATDAAGNLASCSFSITTQISDCWPPKCLNDGACDTGTQVGDGSFTCNCTAGWSGSTCEIDTASPEMIQCPDVSVNVTDGSSFVSVSWDNPVFSDNSGNFTMTCNKTSAELYAIGSTAVHCVAEDAAGNSAACLFAVNVQGMRVICDAVAAVFTCGLLAEKCAWTLPEPAYKYQSSCGSGILLDVGDNCTLGCQPGYGSASDIVPKQCQTGAELTPAAIPLCYGKCIV